MKKNPPKNQKKQKPMVVVVVVVVLRGGREGEGVWINESIGLDWIGLDDLGEGWLTGVR